MGLDVTSGEENHRHSNTKCRVAFGINTLGVVMGRGSNMSFHAGQGTRAGELLQNEGVRARKRRTAPRRRELACINALRQSVFLRKTGRFIILTRRTSDPRKVSSTRGYNATCPSSRHKQSAQFWLPR